MLSLFNKKFFCIALILFVFSGFSGKNTLAGEPDDEVPCNPKPPQECCTDCGPCQNNESSESGVPGGVPSEVQGRYLDVGSSLSLTEGNLYDSYQALAIQSSSSQLLGLNFSYNSNKADGSNYPTNTVMGFGWTHTYNIFLTVYRMDVFKHGGNGRARKFDFNPDGTYDSPEGGFETLVKNPDDTFDMTLKNGTVYHFEKLDPFPFLMPSPPYYVTRITDQNGKITTFTYNDDSLLSQITGPYGRTVQLTYNAQKKLDTITDPLGRVTYLDYDPNGYRLLKITDPLGNTVEYTYNVKNQIIRKKDKDGNLFRAC